MLEKVYYRNIRIQKTPPVKYFLSNYVSKDHGKNKQKEHGDKIIAEINAKIDFIAERNGQAIQPIAKSLRGYKFFEIMNMDSDNLIRIFYFCYHKEKLILLNAFDKPKKYEKGLKKKVDRMIEKELKKTQKYYEDFINNPNHYEKYE